MIRRRFSEEGPTAFVWHVDAERKAASSWALVCVVWKRCRMERTVRARASVQTHALHTLVTTLGCAFEMGERKGDILKPTPSFHPAKGGGDAQRGRGPPAPSHSRALGNSPGTERSPSLEVRVGFGFTTDDSGSQSPGKASTATPATRQDSTRPGASAGPGSTPLQSRALQNLKTRSHRDGEDASHAPR